jgi:hypothetical protein
MTLLGVKAPQIQAYEGSSMKLFVEVHNPTGQNLNLQRLQYRLVAETWFDSKGEVLVERMIAAGASAVVEILVPVTDKAKTDNLRGVPYVLDARLFATSDKTERSWKLRAEGALASSPSGLIQVAKSL